MQTTLHIDDAIYQRAEAAAASEGMTLPEFVEDALRLRLSRAASPPADTLAGSDRGALVEQLQRLFDQADERDRQREGSAGPFSRQEQYAERLERFR